MHIMFAEEIKIASVEHVKEIINLFNQKECSSDFESINSLTEQNSIQFFYSRRKLYGKIYLKNM